MHILANIEHIIEANIEHIYNRMKWKIFINILENNKYL